MYETFREVSKQKKAAVRQCMQTFSVKDFEWVKWLSVFFSEYTRTELYAGLPLECSDESVNFEPGVASFLGDLIQDENLKAVSVQPWEFARLIRTLEDLKTKHPRTYDALVITLNRDIDEKGLFSSMQVDE